MKIWGTWEGGEGEVGETPINIECLTILEGCKMVEFARSFSQLFIHFITFKF
jgi:hypothetical protein